MGKLNSSDLDILNRPEKENNQENLFDIDPDWRLQWWDMPEFSMKDVSPLKSITINFITEDDFNDFKKLTELPITMKSDSIWFPNQKRLNGSFFWSGEKTDSKYPICIPSKGRYDVQTTGKVLDGMGVSYHFFVEETEGDKYIERFGKDKVIVMPFHDLGQGSIPARNFIWDWAKQNGFKRHWTVDDNISCFIRCTSNRRLIVRGGGFFKAMEDFIDRYDNIAMAGPHHQGFVMDRNPNLKPFIVNSRVYSCILLDTTLPYRWRGRYNEDTDLSLRLLKDNYCTLLFTALCMNKGTTVGCKDAKPMKGGNTDNVYIDNDYRLKFAKSLEEQHPDIVKVVWKFNRWHHQVDYSGFKKNKLRLKPGITPIKVNNEYGMQLVKDDEV